MRDGSKRERGRRRGRGRGRGRGRRRGRRARDHIMYHFLSVLSITCGCSCSDRDSLRTHKKALNRTIWYLTYMIRMMTSTWTLNHENSIFDRTLGTCTYIYTYTDIVICQVVITSLAYVCQVAFMNYYTCANINFTHLFLLGMSPCGPLSAWFPTREACHHSSMLSSGCGGCHHVGRWGPQRGGHRL